MDTPREGCVIMTTTGNADEADRLAEGLVRLGLAACVQILPITSRYVWDGKLERQAEHLLLIKTLSARFEQVEAFLRGTHSYSIPEIVLLPWAGASDDYFRWVKENAGGQPSSADA
jgi:uncharacterized protein involved in tolerance to divalent cations